MLIYIIIIVVGVILDQVTKMAAVLFLSGVTTLPIIPNVIHLTYVENTGAAFNLFNDMQFLLISITLVFIVVLGYLFFILPKTKRFVIANLALSLMLSGAIGNLIDRIRLSYVVDFLDFRVIGFAVFNVADTLVVVGTALLVYALIRNQQIFSEFDLKNKKKRKVNPTPEVIEEEVIVSESPKPEPVVNPEPKTVNTITTPKRKRRVNIAPDVKTTIKRLPSRAEAISYAFSTTVDNDPVQHIEEPPVKIYNREDFRDPTPVQTTSRTTFTDNGFTNEDNVVIVKNNRYSLQSDRYSESIKSQREDREPAHDRLKDRYRNNIRSYEESIKKQKEEKESSQDSVWNPEISQPKVKVKDYTPTWNPELSNRNQRDNSNRYQNQIDHYENSIQEQKNNPSNLNEEIVWEPVSKNRKPKKSFDEVIEVETEEVVETPTRKPKNRYDEYTESYLKSIEEASKKSYTKK